MCSSKSCLMILMSAILTVSVGMQVRTTQAEWSGHGFSGGTPAVSPSMDANRVNVRSGSKLLRSGLQRSGGITLDVHASSAPNAFGSPSWAGYLVNALYALENNLGVNVSRATSPTGYERAAAVIPPGDVAVTSFASWRGILSPAAPFSGEFGNRLHFGLHAYGDGATQFTLEDVTFDLHSDDPWDSLVFVGDLVGLSYNGTTRYGIDWVDGIKGNGNDIVYTSGNGTTPVDEIVYVGVGNAWWPSGGVPQDDMDDYINWVASEGPFNVTCTYDILGNTGSDTVLVEQVRVDDFGVEGWKSDDTRNSAGTDLVGINNTHYGRPGQAPTAVDDTAIASQLLFVSGPGGVPALELTKSGPGFSKCTLSTVNESGFASDDWRAGFYANYRYYATSTTEVAVMKIGVRSPLWGTGAGQSQSGFTAVRSGESAWDLILVDWRGTQPPWTAGAWDRFNTDANTQCWRVYRQGANGFFNAMAGPAYPQVGWSLNELYAMSDLGTPAHVARTGYTWSQMLFGAGAKVAGIQFGVGSSTGSSTSYIDYVDTSLLNGGARVDFYGPAPVTIAAYPSQVPDEQDPRVILGDAPTGFEPDSWQNSATGKVNWHARYLADGNYLSDLFPAQAATLTLNDVASIRYWTKRPAGTAAGRDWLLFVYTRPPGDASWYGKRFVNNFDEHTNIGSWVQYSTDNDMTFRKNSGTPTGLMTFADLKTTYGTELIEMISVQTDSGWSGTFDGYMDGLTITLTDGSVGRVDFVKQPTITLDADDECYATGETVTVEINMHDVPVSVVGGQFFLQYDQTKLDFVSAAPGDAPFTLELYESVNEGSGTIDYSVNAPSGDPGASGNAKMAVVTFTALSTLCTETSIIAWRAHDPPTRLSEPGGQAVYPATIDMDLLDDVDPVITFCPPDVTVECDESTLPANTGTATATDNCDGTPAVNYGDVVTAGSCPQGSSIARTWSATDDCGNSTTCLQTITVNDVTAPMITCPPTATIECDASLEPGLPYGTISGGIMVRYNSGTEIPSNQAYMKAQFSQTNTNGAAFTYSSVPLTGSGFTWSLLYGQVPMSQFGFDLVLEAPTASIVIPYTTAYNNTDNTIPGRAADGLVRWAINDYKASPGGPSNPANSAINSHVRAVSGPDVDPLVDIEILSLNLVSTPPIFTMTISGVLHSDGIHHWYTIGQPDTPMSNFNLNGDFYFTGTLTYDSTLDVTSGGDFYAGTIQLLANSPSVGLGFALATDNCDLFPVITYTDAPSLGGCNGTGSITRTWKATDGCGNFSTCDQTINVVDTTDPVLSACPADITVLADAGSCGAVVSYTAPTATDNCDLSPMVNCTPASGSTFASGTTMVTCTATDACGNSSQCMFGVTVEAYSEMDVTVQFSPTMAAGPFDRCITFEFRNCPGTTLLATSTHLMEFTGGTTGLVTIEVPCGNYDCVTARDRQHTLRRTDEGFGISGTKYVADFTLSPPSGDWLIGGNLNDDSWIDILDFGGFSSQWLTTPAPITSCAGSPSLHADINSDGVVNNIDFLFIRNNFLFGHEANCCGAGSVAFSMDAPVERISVRELLRRGLSDLAAGDLNRDGWLDVQDIEAFSQGVRPESDQTPFTPDVTKRATERELLPR